MNRSKKTLDDIENEVKELHPLLEVLLPKLPNVIQVEYTHGTNEFGTDFVLSKHDDTFGDEFHVGVIAKINKITQDFTDIERQIEECELPRSFRGGKKKIYVDEIWVLTTKSISDNAKTKIYAKYKARKISFIDGTRLALLVNQYLPSYWTRLPINLSERLTTIKTRNEEMDMSLSLLPVGNKTFYIQHDIYETRLSKYDLDKGKKRSQKKIDIFNYIRDNNFILVEGGMGSGKSKLLREIVRYFATPDNFVAEHIYPILITFKEFTDNCNSDIEKTINSNIPTEIYKIIKDDAQILLLLDGLDEVDLSLEQTITILQDINKQLKENKSVKLVITSRFLDGITDSDWFRVDCEVLELEPLTLNKTIQFLQELCFHLNLKNRIIEDLKRSTLFRELPRSPISAILLAQLLKENSEDIPANMTELYSKYIELSLGRWDINKGLQSQKEYQALDTLMMDITKLMMENNIVEISFSDVKDFFSKYLKERNLEIDADDLFNKVIKRCDLLYANDEKQTISFKHKTFTEFLYAKYIFKHNAIIIDERAFHPYWSNSMFFALGLQRDCPDYIEALINYQPEFDSYTWLKVANMSNYLLASYTTPYETIEKALAQTLLEAALLYKRAVSGNSEDLFNRLSPMTILYILQFLIRDSYSYNFFKPAIEPAALIIDGSEYPEDVKAYALFFLTLIGVEIGVENQFDFLIDNYAKGMPLDLVMGIYYETKKISDKSKIIRKQISRVKNLLRGNQGLQNKVKELFETPVNKLKAIK